MSDYMISIDSSSMRQLLDLAEHVCEIARDALPPCLHSGELVHAGMTPADGVARIVTLAVEQPEILDHRRVTDLQVAIAEIRRQLGERGL